MQLGMGLREEWMVAKKKVEFKGRYQIRLGTWVDCGDWIWILGESGEMKVWDWFMFKCQLKSSVWLKLSGGMKRMKKVKDGRWWTWTPDICLWFHILMSESIARSYFLLKKWNDFLLSFLKFLSYRDWEIEIEILPAGLLTQMPVNRDLETQSKSPMRVSGTQLLQPSSAASHGMPLQEAETESRAVIQTQVLLDGWQTSPGTVS